jgi:hypothetical protein
MYPVSLKWEFLNPTEPWFTCVGWHIFWVSFERQDFFEGQSNGVIYSCSSKPSKVP